MGKPTLPSNTAAVMLRRAVDFPPMLGPLRTAMESSSTMSFLTHPSSSCIQYGQNPFRFRVVPPATQTSSQRKHRASHMQSVRRNI